MNKKKIIIISVISVIILLIIEIILINSLNSNQSNDEQSNNEQQNNEQITYTVTFVDYDGTELKVEAGLKSGTSATAPIDPTREGYIFIGWDKSFENVTDNITVTAQYEKDNKPKFVVSTVETKKDNNIVEITIDVVNNPNIASIAISVNFDEKLTLTNIEYNDEIGGYSMPPQAMTSPTKLTWISPLANVSGDFTFVTLTFEVTNDSVGKLPIIITYDEEDIYDMSEENIDFDIINGSINIIE